MNVFRSARIRLTAWYVLVLALIGIALSNVIYLTVRSQIRNGVDDGVRLVADRASSDVATTALATGRPACAETGMVNEGYQVVVVWGVGFCGTETRPALQREGLPNRHAVRIAASAGHDLRTLHAHGTALRVYTAPVIVQGLGRIGLYVQVARSLAPEEEALDRILTVLVVGGTIGLVLSAIGGWFLAGKALEPVGEAFDRQQAFIADASHELRTPLAVIRANAEFLQLEHPENAEVADIVAESHRMSGLVDALLALARGDRASAPQTRVDLADVAEQASASLRPLADERGVGLTVDAHDRPQVLGDRDQLHQLVVILVDNALRYTPAGGQVTVRSEAAEGEARLTVQDTGIGIPPEALGRVFERFYRTDEARNRDSGGAGLGLSIARKLAEQHGGRIEAESEVGRGSRFVVRLPWTGGRDRASAALVEV